MIGTIIRNYKNAGVDVIVSLYVQQDAAQKSFSPLFVHGGTGLEVHNLARAAHNDLLRQARASVLPRLQGKRFEDVAWRVAAHALVRWIPELRARPAAAVNMAIPYACFISEYLSKSYRQGEGRDVCISVNGEVFINSIAGLHTDSMTLGRYME